MMDLPPAIETRGLSKRYKSAHALRGLDLRVPAGSIYGLVGRNGAGKTTTIKILMGLVHPTSGEGREVGYRIDDVADGRRIRRGTAYVGEDRAMWPDMTVSEVLAVSRPFFPRWRTDLEREYLEAFEIPQQKRIGRFSKGARSAFAMVLALARGADLLLLDEPTEGLDPILVERVLQALVRAVADNPVLTVFFSSHRLFEVERIADRVGILHDGRLLFDDSLDELKTAYKRVVATFDDAPPDALRTLDGVRHARAEGRMISLLASRHVDDIVAESRARGARQVDAFPVSLNDIFLDAVGDRVD
jgi:ABC-2 type transport system ATP-binding protein